MFKRNNYVRPGRWQACIFVLATVAFALAQNGCSNRSTTASVDNPETSARHDESSNPSAKFAETDSWGTSERLEASATNDVWLSSALATARRVHKLIESEHFDDATKLTRRALELPRHPDRNDPFAWGHATLCAKFLIDGLVDAERWDDIIEFCNDPELKIGNEFVDSQRIRALSLAHWSRHQFVFRSRILNEELNELRRSLANRFDIQHHWNQICTPDELIEIDHEFLDGTKQHIQASREFIAILEKSKQKSKAIGELKTLFHDSSIRLPFDEHSAISESDSTELDQSLDFEKLLKIHRTAPAMQLYDLKDASTSSDGDTGGVQLTTDAGQARLVVFYLGGDCLHCAAQLKAISPYQQKFEDAEIEIVGISADNEEELTASLQDYNGNIRFRILADGERNVFWQFGLVAKRQDEPMHGTFLIDRFGKVLWHDIGVEPFTDIVFLLKESKRLIAISEPKNKDQ